MNEKLLELVVKNGCKKYGSNAMCSGDCFERCKDCIAPIHVERLVDSLVSEGVFALPCKVGDTVYVKYYGEVTNAYITKFEVNSKGVVASVYIDPDTDREYDIGDLFLTREAAERFIEGEER